MYVAVNNVCDGKYCSAKASADHHTTYTIVKALIASLKFPMIKLRVTFTRNISARSFSAGRGKMAPFLKAGGREQSGPLIYAKPSCTKKIPH